MTATARLRSAVLPTITIRPWSRKDRSTSERWPEDNLPKYWFLPGQGEIDGQRLSWAVLIEGETVGRFTLRDRRRQSARLGVYINPDMRGQGIGTAAHRLFLDTVPLELRLGLVYGDIHTENKASYRLFIKNGFVRYRSDVRWHGDDPHVFSLLQYKVLQCIR